MSYRRFLFHQFGKCMTPLGLGFTCGKGRAITEPVMPRLTVSQRLRARLKTLLKRGDQTQIESWSQRPGGSGIRQQELSYFLNAKEGRRGLTLDDLDDLATFFRVTVGELLGDTKTSELSSEEQHLLYAFRALAQPDQEHFLALLDKASLAPRYRGLPGSHQERIKQVLTVAHNPSSSPGGLNASHQIPVGGGGDPTAELERLRAAVTAAILALSSAAESAVTNRPLPNTPAHKPPRGGLAD